MYPRASLANPGVLDSLLERTNTLTPASTRQWGRMTPHQAICHLSDSLLVVMGERPTDSRETLLSRTVIKFIALHSPLPWPKGVPTGKAVDAEADGTKPGDFEADRQRLLALLRRFATPGTRRARHPIFGPLTESEWMMWGFGHQDHHLRQFGC